MASSLVVKLEPCDEYPSEDVSVPSSSGCRPSPYETRSADSWSSSIMALENIKVEIDTFKVDIDEMFAQSQVDVKSQLSQDVKLDSPGVDLDRSFVKLEPLDDDDEFDIDIVRDRFKALEEELSGVGVEIRRQQDSECCPQCYRRLESVFELEAHLRIHRGLEPYKCRSCEYSCTDTEILRSHMDTHTGEKPFECLICSQCFAVKSELRSHTSSHKDGDQFPCQYCDRIFQSKYGLVYHAWKHTGRKPYKCQLCGSAFTRKVTLHIHEARQHKLGNASVTTLEKVACELCPKILSNRQNYLIHMRVHTGEKPFSCPECSRAFRDQSNLIRHRKLHENRYECRRCEQCYSTREGLEQHHCDKGAERRFVCGRCHARFAGYRAYDRHCVAHRHNGDLGRITCDRCDKIFHTKKGYKQHYRLHTGILPYKCEICYRKFRASSHRSRHVAKAHGPAQTTPRLHCPHCDKSFTEKYYLDKHVAIHTGRKPFACEQCDEQFELKRKLRLHKCK